MKPARALDERVRQVDGALPGGCGLDLLPGVAALRLGDRAQLGLVGFLAHHQRVVVQGIEEFAPYLDPVLEIVERPLDQLHVGLIASAELDVAAAQLDGPQQRRRQQQVALELELSQGLEPRGGSGVARHEHGLVDARAREVDPQVVGHSGGLAVLVGAQYREIETPARKLKIIGIAAERGDIRLGREDEPHIVIALVLVQEVLTAVVERDHLAAELADVRVGTRLLAGLLQRGEGLLAGLIRRLIPGARARLVHHGGDVLHRHQNIRDLGGAAPLGIALAGNEAALHQAVVLR